MSLQRGIIHNAGQLDGPPVHLPLEELRVEVLIIDVSARVVLTQVYSNPANQPTSRAKYLFPVPASAAVCAFEARTEDGRLLVAKAVDHDRARNAHENAVRKGQQSALLEAVGDDIFTISIGSIPAKQTIETTVVYCMTLLNDDNADEVRFQLPMSVGDRYGTPPIELGGATGTTSRTRIKISFYIQTSGRLLKISSPSHQGSLEEKRYTTNVGRPSRRRTRIKYRSKTFLDKDFLLLIHAEGLDSPRCFAEVVQPPSGVGTPTIAFQLTLVPKHESIIPQIHTQEYLFVLDRSGSMGGSRIKTAIQTLSILVHMLPMEGTQFNVFSFGSHVDSLWPRSRRYDHLSLLSAVAHIKSMEANYGGTEILEAIKQVFQARNERISTAVFVLTDGEVNDVAKVVKEVENAVRKAPANARLRVFTLGIGDGVSSDLCEGVARAGNGVCLFATHVESIAGKCARLFRAGRTPIVKNVTVDWGVPVEHFTSNAPMVKFSSGLTSVQLRQTPVFQQSPPEIHDLHAGTRLCIYAIMTVKDLQVPQKVKIRGELEGSEDDFELTVPIRGVELVESDSDLCPVRMLSDQPPIHTLAAWRLIQDHQEGRARLPQASPRNAPEEDIRKAAIVRLGEQYDLASKFTSFVVVDDQQDDEPHRRGPGRGSHRQNKQGTDSSPDLDEVMGTASTSFSPNSESWGSILTKFLNPSSSGLVSKWEQTIPGAWRGQRSRSPSPVDEGYNSTRTFSTLSSLDSCSDWSDWSRAATPPPVSEEDLRMLRSPSPEFERAGPAIITAKTEAPVQPLKQEVIELIGLQRFDGSFAPNAQLKKLLGSCSTREETKQQADETVWMTALAIAFMKRHAAGQGELWEKALNFLRRNPAHKSILAMAEATLEKY